MIAQAMGSPVVEDQKLGAGELVDQAREAAIETGQALSGIPCVGGRLNTFRPWPV